MSSTGLAQYNESAPAVTDSPSDQRLRWIELGLMVLIAIVPLCFSSIKIFLQGGSHVERGTFRYLYGGINEIAALGLLWYFLLRSRRTWKNLGLRFSLGAVGMGILIWIGAALASRFAYYVIEYAHFFLLNSWWKPWDLSGILGTTLSGCSCRLCL